MIFTTAIVLSLAQSPDPEALAGLVEAYLEESGTPGAVVAFIADGQPADVHAFGWADVALRRPMTPRTRFQVGSVTKPVTATLLARLEQKGQLSFDDALGDHLEVPEELGSITLRELARHQSRLPREAVNRRNLPNSPSVMIPMSEEELLEGLQRTRRVAEASYSNLGYAVLGLVASEAAETEYDRLVREQVLAPLGMRSSGIFLGDESPAGLASCYWPEDGEPIARTPWRFGSACAFSGLVSTAGDLGLFLSAQMEADGDFLPREALEGLHRPAGSPDARTGMALATGWFVASLPGGLQAIAHGGEVDGHSSTIAFFPKLKTGVVVLCNRGGNSAEMLSRQVTGLAMASWMRDM